LIALQVWVEPRLFKLKWDNPVLTFVILLSMADAFGLVGIIVAPYISAIVHIIWRLLVSDRRAAGTPIQILDLKEQQERQSMKWKARRHRSWSAAWNGSRI
jgi:predicted PurR-regulated permease PerM